MPCPGICHDLSLGTILGVLHIRLVKGIHSQHGAGDRCSHLPAIEFRPQLIVLDDVEDQNRVTSLLQRFHLRIELTLPAQVSKDPVRPITSGGRNRFAFHRQDAPALFPA